MTSFEEPQMAAEGRGRPAGSAAFCGHPRFLGLQSHETEAGALDYGIAVLLTNASRFPSGDHDGTLIVPCPP